MSASFSIVIPMYNAEKYIDKALTNFINMDYDKDLIQVIVIDDSSTDMCADIVKEYSKKYKFIEYYKKPNGQWGSVINYAKNKKLVKNDYVAVLDADDFYDISAFKILDKISNNNDMIVGTFRKYDGNRVRKIVRPFWFLFKKNINDQYQMCTPFCLPNTFFSKKEIFYKLNDLTEGVPYQDPDYLTQLIKNSKTMVFTRKVISYYYYNRVNNSVSQVWDEKRFNPEYNACIKCLENGFQEMVSYRLNVRPLKKMVKEKNIKFEINRKFCFNWYPFYLRPMYKILHFFSLRKLFIMKEKPEGK